MKPNLLTALVAAASLAACAQTQAPNTIPQRQDAVAAPAVPEATARAASSSLVASAPAATVVDPAVIDSLKVMGKFLQSLKRFQLTTELMGEVVLVDGQKLQHNARADMDVQRPGMIRTRMSSARGEREIYFNGKVVTFFLPSQNYYSRVNFSGSIGELTERLEDHYGIEVPLTDLFLWGTSAAPLEKIESAMNAGQDFIGTDLCNHYAFRQGNTDWQIWIKADGNPLPRKLVITNRADEARPQSISMVNWNLSPRFSDAIFTFTPPKGATSVELRALRVN